MTWRQSLAGSALAFGVSMGVALVAGAAGVHVGPLPLAAMCCAMAFAMQWLAAVPAIRSRTEHSFDLVGALTFLVCTFVAVALGKSSERTILLAILVSIWAVRLGAFLAARVLEAGGDRRFDSIRAEGPRFLLTWSLQGAWVSITLLPVILAASVSDSEPLGALDALGAGIWLLGVAIEWIADAQKTSFRRKRKAGEFMSSGLWSYSRHPNYAGEILAWTGVALVASAEMRGASWLGLLSPVFVYILLRFVSGVPLLEESAEEGFGHLPSYQDYVRRTPILFPAVLMRRRGRSIDRPSLSESMGLGRDALQQD